MHWLELTKRHQGDKRRTVPSLEESLVVDNRSIRRPVDFVEEKLATLLPDRGPQVRSPRALVSRL
jgi:hypothetical protein